MECAVYGVIIESDSDRLQAACCGTACCKIKGNPIHSVSRSSRCDNTSEQEKHQCKDDRKR